MGRLHGACVQKGILDKAGDKIMGATGNSVSVGTKGDATEADYTFAKIADAIKAILVDGYAPNVFMSAYDKFWTCMTTDWDMKMFYGSLSDFIVSGKAPQVMGLEVLLDPYFETMTGTWDGTDGEKYAAVFTREYSLGWAEMQSDPEVEIYRLPTELSDYVVTHLDGGAAKLVDNSICIIKHAA